MLNKGFSTFIATVIAFIVCLVSRPSIPYAFIHEDDRVDDWHSYNDPEENDFVTFAHSNYDNP